MPDMLDQICKYFLRMNELQVASFYPKAKAIFGMTTREQAVEDVDVDDIYQLIDMLFIPNFEKFGQIYNAADASAQGQFVEVLHKNLVKEANFDDRLNTLSEHQIKAAFENTARKLEAISS